MKNKNKILLSGLIVTVLIGTIGAALVSADDNSTNIPDKANKFFDFEHRMMPPMPCLNQLTEEQQTELNNLITSLQEQNATPEEIRTIVQEKLVEWCISTTSTEITDEDRDQHLSQQINQTEQRLDILYRVQELRNQGMSYEDIKNIVEEEFNITAPHLMDYYQGFGHGHRQWHPTHQNSLTDEGSQI